jgi:hypothetical protein
MNDWFGEGFMTASDMVGEPGSGRQRYLELLVPLLSFGITGIGIFLWQQGFVFNYQFFSLGCIISSCILAYLAWIRPHRDIVALTTPVYAFIFFLVPSDDISWIVLQLLYGVSLTALLLRLKYRFGSSAPKSGTVEEDGILAAYAGKVRETYPAIPPAIAGDAGLVFMRFSLGEYEAAARLAATRSQDPSVKPFEIPATAFAIVAEQAARTSTGIAAPDIFKKFSPDQYEVLYSIPKGGLDPEQEYTLCLDNSLLLLYAIALVHANEQRKQEVISFRKFARKIAGLN